MVNISSTEVIPLLPQLLARVQQGEEVQITESGHTVAMLVRAPTLSRPFTPAEPDSGLPLAGEAWQQEFAEWGREIAARAVRYPAGFRLDDSREAIYEGVGE